MMLCQCAMCRDTWKNQSNVFWQEPHGPKEPRISDNEVASDGDDEHYKTNSDDDKHYETAGLCLAVRPVVQQKVKHKQPTAQGVHPQGASNVPVFKCINHIYSGGVGQLG